MNLFDMFPRDWYVEYDEDGVVTVLSSNGKTVLFRESFTGDGDLINLQEGQIEELVETINNCV